MNTKYTVYLTKSKNKNKKYNVKIYNNNGDIIKNIDFGAFGYEDYTIHKDEKRKDNYMKRHNINYNYDNIMSAAFWAFYL